MWKIIGGTFNFSGNPLHWMQFNNGSVVPIEQQMLFQAGWFIFGTLSQILIVHVIRTKRIPFVQSRASKPLVYSSIIIGALACLVAFTGNCSIN